MDYESLLVEADNLGLTVKEKPLKYNNGRIKGRKIAIRQNIETQTEKSCVLAEELGHYYTSVGNILDQNNTNNHKQELRARLWAYNNKIGLNGIVKAALHHCNTLSEMAKYLDVTEEFLFCDIPWGTSYTEADKILNSLDIWPLAGESYMTMSVDDIALGVYEGIDFKYSDINIIAHADNREIDVAGYTTSDVCLYFSYIPVNGVLTKKENDSALYGAQYMFEPKNIKEMSDDLISKLSSLYGSPGETYTTSDGMGQYEYTHWYGANNTEVVLRGSDYSQDEGIINDEIYISYVWRRGDELLQNASDLLAAAAIAEEADVYGNESTNGL